MLRGKVTAHIHINTSYDRLIQALFDWQLYCDIMPNVKRIETGQFLDTEQTLEVNIISLSPTNFKETTSSFLFSFNKNQNEISFIQKKGLLSQLNGRRIIEISNKGLIINSCIQYEIGFVDPQANSENSIHSRIENNVKTYLQSLKQVLESKQPTPNRPTGFHLAQNKIYVSR